MNTDDLTRMNRVLRHRLRNLASGMQNAVTLLSKELDDRLRPHEREYFPLLLNECHELRRLTDRLSLWYDELSPGGECRLATLLETVVAQVRRDTPTATIAVDGVAEWGAAVVAAQQFLAVPLAEVVANAVQAKAGGPVRIVCARGDGALVLHVADTGPGLTDDQVAQAFAPFVTSRPRRLGLGLAIARRWAARLGGTVTVHTHGSDGCCVDLVLPLASTPAENEWRVGVL